MCFLSLSTYKRHVVINGLLEGTAGWSDQVVEVRSSLLSPPLGASVTLRHQGAKRGSENSGHSRLELFDIRNFLGHLRKKVTSDGI